MVQEETPMAQPEQPQPQPRRRRRQRRQRQQRQRRAARRQVGVEMMPLARRAQELGMTTASLRRYVNLGAVSGQSQKTGNRIYVSTDLVVTSPRARMRTPVSAPAAARGRHASITRETGETAVTVELDLDGQGQVQAQTGDGTLNHLLAQIARHGLIDLAVDAMGDDLSDNHHLVEDVAIALGRALRQAVGDGSGIRRMGSAIVPLDDALAMVAVDVGGRGYAVVDGELEGTQVGSLSGELITHFLERFAIEGGVNLHVQVLGGDDPHHKAEAIFKGLARSLRAAVEEDPRAAGAVPSTKGSIG